MAQANISMSPTPIESTETNSTQIQVEEPRVTHAEWDAMDIVIRAAYNHREADGHDPSKVFQRKVNKRILPDYYDVIKEPMALSTLKQRLATKSYKTFSEFVRDCALIPHNAQTYNRPEAQAYQDALVIKALFESEFRKLAEEKIISQKTAVLPDLGEIPPADPRPIEEEEEEDDDDEEDEDDEGDDSDEEGTRRKRRRGPRGTAAISKRQGASKEDAGHKSNDAKPRKKRGRPPKVDTPMEARINAILKGLRKLKNPTGLPMIRQFMHLLAKDEHPGYYVEIKEPIAVEVIKKKQKRRKYQSVDHFMKDIDTMFNNAKIYNEDESQVYKEANQLQIEAHRLADQEKQKPDTEYAMEDGRLSLPNGILHNGELWKVGDWVHIQNPNDVTKPIVTQIYRTWQDTEGQKWVNAVWYYRPEWTVHQYEKHFYPNEVMKTGQYRDHHIDEVIDRCFVMFFTRYNRGRPRGFPPDKEVYVCEARYNEEKFKLNKIKTWASCLPDEVREKDYEMDLFDGARKIKKIPSPIKHLLKDDAKETDDLPKPTWGAENAPPVVGAVHKRPREENDSPPPEPTPSPPPQPAPQPTRQAANAMSHEHNSYRRGSQGDIVMGGTALQVSTTAPSSAQPNQGQISYEQKRSNQPHQYSASPAPTYQHYNQQVSSYTPQTTHNTFPTPQQRGHIDQYNTPQSGYAFSQPTVRNTVAVGNAYNPPRPIEVYHLSDAANLSIPEDIREQFHRDEHGHVLFFTTPPLDTLPPAKHGEAVGHSVRYLAEKAKRIEAIKEKRKREQQVIEEQSSSSKKAKQEEEIALAVEVKRLTGKAMQLLGKDVEEGTKGLYRDMLGEKWEEGMGADTKRLQHIQAEERRKMSEIEENARRTKERQMTSLKGNGVYLDDVDARY
ncbi:MAG: hypothetical protein M1830_009168 [Pleopsidium flavum]|nr:MAG: hypothetical protein M1830_009168 [Pleopsidium flavum]